MTALNFPNLALRQAPYHPAELLSDADPVRAVAAEYGDSSMHLLTDQGTHSQLTTAPPKRDHNR